MAQILKKTGDKVVGAYTYDGFTKEGKPQIGVAIAVTTGPKGWRHNDGVAFLEDRDSELVLDVDMKMMNKLGVKLNIINEL